MAPKRRKVEANGGPSVQPHKPLHRHTFLQTLMSRGWLPEIDARRIYREIVKTESDSRYTEMIGDINQQLELVQLQVRRIKYPLDGEWYLGLVNKVQDEQSKIGSRLSHQEREFFRSMMEALATSHDATDGMASIGSLEAANMSQASTSSQLPPTTQAGKKMSGKDKEAALKKLIQEGWLAVPPGEPGRYSIGARSFLELSEYLLSMDIPDSTRTAWETFL